MTCNVFGGILNPTLLSICTEAISPVLSMQEESWNMSRSFRAVFYHINECVIVVHITVHYDDDDGPRLLCIYCLRQKRTITETQACLVTVHNAVNILPVNKGAQKNQKPQHQLSA